MEGVNSQLSRVKETLLYTSCKVFYPQMTLQPSLFVRWLAGLTEQREVNAATLRGETPKPGARRRAAADELAFPPVHSPSTSLTEIVHGQDVGIEKVVDRSGAGQPDNLSMRRPGLTIERAFGIFSS